jgi:hypothetical protein
MTDETMTDEQKEKLAYSQYQDKLAWSRANYLIAVQGAALAGIYSIRESRTAAFCLAVLATIITIMIWLVAERDQFVRDRAFIESGVTATDTSKAPDLARLKGKYAYRVVFVLLLLADFVAIFMPLKAPQP